MRRDEQSKVTSSRELFVLPSGLNADTQSSARRDDELAGKRATLNAGST